MRPLAFVFVLCSFVCSSTFAQFGWQTTPAGTVQRYDDLFFINADTGWAITPWDGFSNQPAKILRTTDSGASWETQLDSSGMTFRSMGFFDANDGFIGVLEEGQTAADTAVMLHTTDGGQNWLPVNNLPGPRPSGGCGIFIIGDSTMYAVGRYFGPAHIYKTTDRGQSWDYQNLDSLAGGLVDAHFWSADSGIVVGTTGDYFDSSGVILHTFDGGQSWARQYVTQQDGRMCWKISFPSHNVGYISIQQFGGSSPSSFIKTTDGGATWFEQTYWASSYNAQGIGFLNDSVGWIGGNYSGFLNFLTTDGGATWTNQVWGARLNRFQKINDSLVFAAGREVYKWTGFPIVGIDPADKPSDWNVSLAWPNPAQETAWLEVDLPAAEALKVQLFDLQGRLIEEGQDEMFPAGQHQIAILTGKLSDGMYLVRVQMGNVVKTVRLAVQR
jgi:photosystem II stability/assembly factor-like uncharacterized protein